MAFSSGFLSPPSSQALSWTGHTVSILIPPDLYWVHPGSSASCSGPKQNKICISAWYILKNDPCCAGSLGLVVIWLLRTLFFFTFSQTADTDRDLSPQSSHIRAHTRACTHTDTLANKLGGFIFTTLSTRGFVCKAEKRPVSIYLMEVQTQAKVGIL